MKAKFISAVVVVIKFKTMMQVFCSLLQKMEELVHNTVEASGEKHLPDVKVADKTVYVNVGSVDHPMIPAHYIEWVYLETEKGGQIKKLTPEDAPKTSFCVGDDKAVAVYAYCNLHGLWKTEL